MSYQLTLSIRDNSVAERNIEAIVETEHISREEAAIKLLETPVKRSAASPAARRIIGAFREDAALMDEVIELAMEDRQRRNAAPPHA